MKLKNYRLIAILAVLIGDQSSVGAVESTLYSKKLPNIEKAKEYVHKFKTPPSRSHFRALNSTEQELILTGIVEGIRGGQASPEMKSLFDREFFYYAAKNRDEIRNYAGRNFLADRAPDWVRTGAKYYYEEGFGFNRKDTPELRKAYREMKMDNIMMKTTMKQIDELGVPGFADFLSKKPPKFQESIIKCLNDYDHVQISQKIRYLLEKKKSEEQERLANHTIITNAAEEELTRKENFTPELQQEVEEVKVPADQVKGDEVDAVKVPADQKEDEVNTVRVPADQVQADQKEDEVRADQVGSKKKRNKREKKQFRKIKQ